MSATKMSPFQIHPAYKAYPRNNPGKTFFPNWWILDWSVAEIGIILNQWTKRHDRSFKRFSKTSLIWGFPIRQEILNISQIGIAFHGICPPILQQYGRGAFFYSAHCSFSDPTCFWSVWCRRTMIPGKDLHRLCQIPRNCQCKWH